MRIDRRIPQAQLAGGSVERRLGVMLPRAQQHEHCSIGSYVPVFFLLRRDLFVLICVLKDLFLDDNNIFDVAFGDFLNWYLRYCRVEMMKVVSKALQNAPHRVSASRRHYVLCNESVDKDVSVLIRRDAISISYEPNKRFVEGLSSHGGCHEIAVAV